MSDITDPNSGLGNTLVPFIPAHPYRFVFLNACETAENPNWSHAFGIPQIIQLKSLEANKRRPQAFLGWKGTVPIPYGDDMPTSFADYQRTMWVFIQDWMSLKPLTECIADASNRNFPDPFRNPPHLARPLQVKENADIYKALFPDVKTEGYSDLQIFGYPRITRDGYR